MPTRRGHRIERTNLFREHMGSKILERQLELSGVAAEEHLDHDGRVQRHGNVGRRHGGQVRLIEAISE
jgi:hypothetical protein